VVVKERGHTYVGERKGKKYQKEGKRSLDLVLSDVPSKTLHPSQETKKGVGDEIPSDRDLSELSALREEVRSRGERGS